MKEVEGSIKALIDTLESIFELQKLKDEFRFFGHTRSHKWILDNKRLL